MDDPAGLVRGPHTKRVAFQSLTILTFYLFRIITDHSKPDKAPIKLLVLQTDMRKTMEELCRRKEEVRALKRELGPEEEAISHHDSTQAGAELHSHIPIQCELDDVTTSRTSDINRDRLEEEENEPKSELFVLIEAERKKREEGIEVGREPVLMEEPKWGCVGYLARGFIAPTVRAVVELAFVPSLNVEECQRELGFGGPGPNEETDAGH